MVKYELPFDSVEFPIVSPLSVSLHINSVVLANGAVNMMHAINHAAGILHKNNSKTFRRCHGPQFPIMLRMPFDGGGEDFVIDSIVAIPFILLICDALSTVRRLEMLYFLLNTRGTQKSQTFKSEKIEDILNKATITCQKSRIYP